MQMSQVSDPCRLTEIPEHILRIFLNYTKGEAAKGLGDVRGVPSGVQGSVLEPVPN